MSSKPVDLYKDNLYSGKQVIAALVRVIETIEHYYLMIAKGSSYECGFYGLAGFSFGLRLITFKEDPTQNYKTLMLFFPQHTVGDKMTDSVGPQLDAYLQTNHTSPIIGQPGDDLGRDELDCISQASTAGLSTATNRSDSVQPEVLRDMLNAVPDGVGMSFIFRDEDPSPGLPVRSFSMIYEQKKRNGLMFDEAQTLISSLVMRGQVADQARCMAVTEASGGKTFSVAAAVLVGELIWLGTVTVSNPDHPEATQDSPPEPDSDKDDLDFDPRYPNRASGIQSKRRGTSGGGRSSGRGRKRGGRSVTPVATPQSSLTGGKALRSGKSASKPPEARESETAKRLEEIFPDYMPIEIPDPYGPSAAEFRSTYTEALMLLRHRIYELNSRIWKDEDSSEEPMDFINYFMNELEKNRAQEEKTKNRRSSTAGGQQTQTAGESSTNAPSGGTNSKQKVLGKKKA
ncbi:hypothetical protein C8Q78DRAFT_1080479 [Trametes maxima]|nr:hypothetical protein C8Q78DRAFT_1080479 [Trametes maxima]